MRTACRLKALVRVGYSSSQLISELLVVSSNIYNLNVVVYTSVISKSGLITAVRLLCGKDVRCAASRQAMARFEE